MRYLFFQFISTNGVWKWAAQKIWCRYMSVAGSSNVVKWAAATMRHKCFGYCSEGGYFLQNIFICGGREITAYCNVLAESLKEKFTH
jgi:hypothetical protein